MALAARRRDGLLDVQAGLDGATASLVAVTDVTDRGQVKELVERAGRELGPVDVLVNRTRVMNYTRV